MLAMPPFLFAAAALLLAACACSAQNLAWTRETGTTTTDNAQAIALHEADDSVYVAGRCFGSLNGQPHAGGFDIVLIKYDSNGTLLWTRETGTLYSDVGWAVALDASATAYVAGSSEGYLNGQPFLGYSDIALLKYSANGTLLWTREVGTTGNDFGYGVATNVNCSSGVCVGGVYVTGTIEGSMDGQAVIGYKDMVVIKFLANSTMAWARQTGSISSDESKGVAVDVFGNVHITGSAPNSVDGQPALGGADIVLVKYTADGGWLWTRQTGTGSTDRGEDVTCDPDGNAYVTGYSWGSLNGQPYAGKLDIVLIKYSAAGETLWTREAGTSETDYGYGVAVTDGGAGVVVVGYTSGSLNGQPHVGMSDIVVLKYDHAGVLLFTRQTGSLNDDHARGVAIDTAGSIYVAGYSKASLNGQPYAGDADIVVLKYCSSYGIGHWCECLGAYSANGIVPCTGCPAGQWSSVRGVTSCQSCAAGQFSDAGSTACTHCPRGTFAVSGVSAASLCTPCGAGKWSTVLGASGSTSCSLCPAGSWSSTSAASAFSACAGCGPGRFGTLVGSTNSTQCARCAAGLWSSATTAASSCIACVAGHYATLVGAAADTACDACIAGQFGSLVGASSDTYCELCPLGTYGASSALSAASLCTACPPGAYSATAGANAASQCQPCPPGRASNATGASACAPCDRGTYAMATGSTACVACAAGDYAAVSGESACSICPAGHHSPNASACIVCDAGLHAPIARSSACTACALGTYTSAVGAMVCPRCPMDHYSDAEGSSSCSACPDNTTTVYTDMPVSRQTCLCLLGMYGPPAGPCSRCPVGAECLGAQAVPIAAPGYYGVWGGPGSVFLECSPPEACRGGDASDCTSGYRGEMCAQCDAQFYRLEHRCVPCPDAPGWRIVLFVVVGLLLAVFLVLAAGSYGSYFSSFSILFSYLQVLAILAELNVTWPALLRDTFEAMSIFNFNADLLATECTWEVKYEDKWATMVLLPFIFLGAFVLIFASLEAIPWVMKRVLSRRGGGGDTEMQDVQGGAAAGAGAVAKVKIRVISIFRRVIATQRVTPADRRALLELLFNAYLMLLSFCYIFVVSKITELFDCTAQPNGRSTLDASPTLQCAQIWWWNLFPLSLLMLLFYGVGFPLAFLLIRRNKNTVSQETYRQRYSLLTSRYKDEFWWWELVVLARKLGIVLSKTFFTTYATFQMLLATVLLVAMMLIQQRMQPFARRRHNLLEFVLLICSYLVMFSGLLFNSVDVRSVAARTTAAAVVVFLIVLLSTVAMVGAVALDVVAQMGQKKNWSASDGGMVGWVMRVFVEADDGAEQPSSSSSSHSSSASQAAV